MTPLEHAIHAVWPLIVVTLHRYVLDKALAPLGRAVLRLFKPERVVEKLVEKAEEVLEEKVEARIRPPDTQEASEKPSTSGSSS